METQPSRGLPRPARRRYEELSAMAMPPDHASGLGSTELPREDIADVVSYVAVTYGGR